MQGNPLLQIVSEFRVRYGVSQERTVRLSVSREHRRAKTDRLDTDLLKRGFLGWLRGERGHCSMARIPTIAEEDAKRPNRERECLVGEGMRIVNRIRASLARLGIRDFRPTLRKAAERLATVHTPEGVPLPPNVLAELQRDMARLGFIVSQISEIEEARQKRLDQQPETGPHAMVRLLARVVGIGIETADMPKASDDIDRLLHPLAAVVAT
jgi:transposase